MTFRTFDIARRDSNEFDKVLSRVWATHWQFIRRSATAIKYLRNSLESPDLYSHLLGSKVNEGDIALVVHSVPGLIRQLTLLLTELHHFRGARHTVSTRHWNTPLVYEIAHSYLASVSGRFRIETSESYFGLHGALDRASFSELVCLRPSLELAIFCSLGAILAGDMAIIAFNTSIREHLFSLDTLASDGRRLVSSQLSYEKLLEQDPAELYISIDSQTKDSYRRSVEVISQRSKRRPEDVCAEALLMCKQHLLPTDIPSRLTCHIGYYLLDDGKTDLIYDLCGKRISRQSPESGLRLTLYIGAYVILTILLSMLSLLFPLAITPVAQLIYMMAIVVFCSQTASSLLAVFLTYALPKRTIPRLEIHTAIPEYARVAIAVPILIASLHGIDEVCRRLVRHAEAAADAKTQLVILSDFPDSIHGDVSEEEESLLRYCSQQIAILNLREAYGPDKFVLLHRSREYSPTHKLWFGKERKRGKLQALYEYILDGTDNFTHHVGSSQRLRTVKYVMVLDEDTELSPGTVRILLGAHIHPLNHSHLNVPNNGCGRGYVIMQPAILGSFDARLVRMGIESPNARNLHYDLFGRCTFSGKGMYNVEAFSSLIGNRLPCDSVLSHDVVESGICRTALLIQASVFEAPPSTYSSTTKRLHRWIRGDWQNLIWLLPESFTRFPPMSPFGKFAICDLTRNTLMPLSLVILLLASCTNPLLLIYIAGLMLVPTHIAYFMASISNWFYFSGAHKINSRRGILAGYTFLALSCARAWHISVVTMDAIIRTICRRVLGRRLLDWTASSVDRPAGVDTLSRIASWEILSALLALLAFLIMRYLGYGSVCFSVWLLCWALTPLIEKSFHRSN